MIYLPILVLLVVYAWLYWCLKKGRITTKSPRGGWQEHKVVTFDRRENPVGFWISWVVSLVGSTAVCIYIFFIYLSQTP